MGTSTVGLESAVEQFGLGRMVEPAVPVDQAWSNDVFRVRTGSGVYAIKLYPVEWSTDRRDVVRGAMSFELTALKRGAVPMPRPVTVDGSWLVDIATESGTRAARCHDWADGTPATREPLSSDLVRDGGRSLGALHALHIPGGDSSQLSSPDLDRWDRSVRDSTRHGFSWARDLAAITPTLRSLATDLELLRAERRPMRISHRDFDPKNAVVDSTGRLVITDWDNAGPVLAEAELIIAATSFATTDDGLRQFVAGYREAGGDAGQADALAMTVEAADVDWLLRNIEGCVRADSSDAVGRLHASTGDLVTSFMKTVAALRAWPERLAALTGGT